MIRFCDYQDLDNCRFVNCPNPVNKGAKPPYHNMCSSCYDEHRLIIKEIEGLKK
jgi:hypothetical protein